MKNLVSKNPVQRFKQGRKILFAKPGDKMLYNGNEEVVEEILNGQTIYRRKNGTYVYPNSKLLSPIKTSTSIDYSFMKEEKPHQRTSGGQKKGELEVQEQKNIQNNIQKKKIITPTKKTVVVNRVLPKYSGVDLQGKTVGEWQNILKNYYAPGTKKKYMEDGIWGDATNAAYKLYLQSQALPEFTPEQVSNPESASSEELRKAIAMQDYTPNPVERKLVSTPITYNRSMTRDWLRNNIGTAYGVSGAMRAAARRKLNGQATDDDIILIKSNQKLYDALKNVGLFKKGGQLPSRNVVERFKNGGIQKFQKAGNLPTAPKAKDRYKDSYKSWDWPQYKEVTAGSRLFPGARISQTIEGSDTTYMETPPRFPFVKVVPRVAKNNTKTIEWRDLITGQTYPEVKRGNSREYETLKRRFNTAWNLAK